MVFEKKCRIISDEHAVLSSPLRLLISLIIGIIVLGAILSSLSNPCLLPKKLVVSVTPMIETIPCDNQTPLTFFIFVNDSSGHTVQGASVILIGLGGASSNTTDSSGKTMIDIQCTFEKGMYEGYLDVSVKAPCHETFFYRDLIKIVKTNT